MDIDTPENTATLDNTGTTEPAAAAHWWSAEQGHARRAALGAAGIGTSLCLIVAAVWALPGMPVVATAQQVAETVANPAAALLKAQNAELTAKVEGLRREVSTRDDALAVAYGGDEDRAQQAVAAVRTPEPAAVPVPVTTPTPAAPVRPAPTARPTAKPTPRPSAPVAPRPTAVPTVRPTPAPTVTVTVRPVVTPKPTPTPTIAPRLVTASKSALVAPANRYFGLYTEQAPFNWATYDAAMAKLAATPQTVGYFSGWDEAFRANAVTRSWSEGLLPIMTWESRPIGAANNVIDEPDYSLHKIINGEFDEYLRTYARAIVATGLPMGIRLNHEMNGTWYPWSEDDGRGRSINGNSAGEYAASWRHVHDVFEQEGANDLVFWIWSPNRINKLTASHRTQAYLASLYPGDDYVDWVGLSGYLRPTYANDDDFSFEYTYGSTLQQVRAIAPGKRILLSEIGASESGGHKVTWVNSLFNALAKPENDDIVGVLWFNLAVSTYTEGVLGTNDWRVDSRPETLAAFKAGLARTDTDFGPLPAPEPTPAPPPSGP